jgi:hypothetical protein
VWAPPRRSHRRQANSQPYIQRNHWWNLIGRFSTINTQMTFVPLDGKSQNDWHRFWLSSLRPPFPHLLVVKMDDLPTTTTRDCRTTATLARRLLALLVTPTMLCRGARWKNPILFCRVPRTWVNLLGIEIPGHWAVPFGNSLQDDNSFSAVSS